MNPKFLLVVFGALVSALFAPASAARAQETLPHAEQCTRWGFIQDINYEFGVVNTCSHAITVWYLSETAEAHGEVAPGGTFSTGLTSENANLSEWIAAVCRSGYRPNVDVSVENGALILSSQYTCVRNDI